MQEGRETEEYVHFPAENEPARTGLRDKLEAFLTGKLFWPAVLILVALIAFLLGRASGLAEKREPVRVIDNSSPSFFSGEVKGASTDSSGLVVASKNGTKYHYPWCAGAKQISDKNKITFESIQAARAAGYAPASNCKGLK